MDTRWIMISAALLVVCGLGSISLLLSEDGRAMLRIRLLRYYRVGDRVTLGGNLQGKVTAINLFTTKLYTAEADYIMVSNRAVVNSPMIVHANPQVPPQQLYLVVQDNEPQAMVTQLASNANNDRVSDALAKHSAELATNDTPITNAVVDDATPSGPPVTVPTAALMPVNQPPLASSQPVTPVLTIDTQPAAARAAPLRKRPQLGHKSATALRMGVIPRRQPRQPAQHLPSEEQPKGQAAQKVASGRQWRFIRKAGA